MQAWVLLWAGRAEGSGALDSYLALHKHGHVHEHVVQLADAVLQLDDLAVPRLDLAQSLLRDAGVHDDLGGGSSGLGHEPAAGGREGGLGQGGRPRAKAAGMGGGPLLSHSTPPTCCLVLTSCYQVSRGRTSQRSCGAACAYHVITARQHGTEAKLTAPKDPGLEWPFSLLLSFRSASQRGQLPVSSLLKPTAPSCLPHCGPPPSGSPLLKHRLNVETAKGTVSPRRGTRP